MAYYFWGYCVLSLTNLSKIKYTDKQVTLQSLVPHDMRHTLDPMSCDKEGVLQTIWLGQCGGLLADPTVVQTDDVVTHSPT